VIEEAENTSTETPAPNAPSGSAADSPAFDLRQSLESRLGISVDSYEDDNAAFEDFATALGTAGEVLNSEEFQDYQKHQEEFQKFLAREQQDSPSAVESPVSPEPAAPASSFTTANVSEDAQLLAQQNLITRGEDGTWVPKQPAFQSFADEYNKHDVAVRTNVMKFSQDPTGFVNKLIEQQTTAPAAELETVKALQEELAAIKQQLADQAAQKSTSTLDDWRKTAPLRDDAGKLTPYAKEYMRWETRIRNQNPSLSPIDTHNKVIDSLDFAGVKPESLNTEPKASSEPRESMVGKVKKRAATNSNGNGHNRLTEYAASAPGSSPGVPSGKAGLPSLHGAIAQLGSSLTN
jgi:hypothetical protein